MATLTFIEHGGTAHEVELEAGKSLMQIAVDNLIPGIDADCGGACACGTCHVIVASDWYSRTGETSDEETMMLGMTPERAETSRLACQIEVSDALDGMTVTLPEYQM